MTSANLVSLVKELTASDLDIQKDVPASNLTTYRLGGELAFLLHLRNFEDVEILRNLVQKYPLDADEIFVLGNGSNLIVADKGFDGLVIKFASDLTEIISIVEVKVEVGAGMLLPKFARSVSLKGLSNCEFYVGIPGSIGGAVAMNAGGHGKQTSDVLIETKVLSLIKGELKTYKNSECEFSYRHSIFSNTDLIISATFELRSGDAQSAKSELDSIVKWRRENQPGGRNIGSVFQNEENVSAGSLIEKCGLKGFRIGGAFVSEKHANFIQADEGATADDVVQLIEHVRKVVKEETGITLRNEVRYIGFE